MLIENKLNVGWIKVSKKNEEKNENGLLHL